MGFSVIYILHAYDTMHCTMALVLIMEKMLLRIPEQMSSSLCWRRCRWMWCKTTGSRILRDSEGRDKEEERREDENEMNIRFTCTVVLVSSGKQNTLRKPSHLSHRGRRRGGSQLCEQWTAV